MPKNIVLCSDGTGNSTTKGRGTNVYKLCEAVDLEAPPNEPSQVVFYDDGVGTGSLKLMRVLGGAFGFGFARNIRASTVTSAAPIDRRIRSICSVSAAARTRCGRWPA